MNDKLNKALKRANLKITEIKDRYKQKISKKCYYCNNELELSMNLTTTLDTVQLTEMNTSFVMMGTGSQVHEEITHNDTFGDQLANDDFEGSNDINLLDNLNVEDSNAQIESDKQRQQQLLNSKKVIMRGSGVKLSQN